jgi:mono/diheme cytochrome c family protein
MKKRLLALTFTAVMLTTGSVASAAADRVVELTMDALDLKADARNGAALYSEQCAGCHGREAQGAGQHDVPALASQRSAARTSSGSSPRSASMTVSPRKCTG